MMNRDNPVWLITGCSTGFGRELAKLVLERGWRAVVTARDPSKVKDIAEAHGDRALVLPLDVTNRQQIDDVVTQARQRFGRIDALVNNAGYGYLAAIEEGEDDEVRAMFETNVFGLVDMTKAVLPIMREQHSGLIVNVSSIGGITSFAATGYYHATKLAVSRYKMGSPVSDKAEPHEPAQGKRPMFYRTRLQLPPFQFCAPGARDFG